MIKSGNFTILRNENYAKFVNYIESRSENVSLITVSNHRSMFDDPGILGCVVPFPEALRPRNIRWNLCAEEICFQGNAFLESFFAAGKTISIFRGGGVNQPHFLDIARQVAAGDWVHIFPEVHY